MGDWKYKITVKSRRLRMTNQKSRLLYHFIGKNLKKDEEKQYGFLLKILRDGFLKPDQKGENASLHLGRFDKKIDFDNRLPVSFIDRDNCDDEEFRKHMATYSRFGLGFERDFILQEHGNPVFYYPYSDKAEYLVRHLIKVIEHFKKMHETDEQNYGKDSFEELLKFVIPFNFNKENRYKEREWRIIANQNDGGGDRGGGDQDMVWDFKNRAGVLGVKCAVKEIIIPQEYYERAKKDLKKSFPGNNMPDLRTAETLLLIT